MNNMNPEQREPIYNAMQSGVMVKARFVRNNTYQGGGYHTMTMVNIDTGVEFECQVSSANASGRFRDEYPNAK